ncbi:hypothetical protein OQA88_9646 [Cercophora sp. LCS_1]
MDGNRNSSTTSKTEGETVDVEKSQTQSNNDHVQDKQQGQATRIEWAAKGSDSGTGPVSLDLKRVGTRDSMSGSVLQLDPEPGFAHIDGDVGGTGYNDTKVDVVAVTCPGADPVQTWSYDPLPEGYFGHPTLGSLARFPTVSRLAGDAIISPAIDRPLPKAGHMWVRQGIRKSANTARVMLYRHRALTEGTNLDLLARDLLDNVQQQRQGTRPSRPLFFIAHSIGGLVVKRALLLATELPEYRELKYNCHGIVFFSTPHQGSSYLSMKSTRESVRQILRLQRALPKSLADEVRVNHPGLSRMQEEFFKIASELRIWTFYETIDSDLSGTSGRGEVQFTAPLVSIKSALLDLWHEDVYSLESDHAHLASFGLNNANTMKTFLGDFTAAIQKARKLSAYIHVPLRLKEHVKVEVIGFYDNTDAETEAPIRLYATRYHLNEFLHKGPERCLEERLSKLNRRQTLPTDKGERSDRHLVRGSAEVVSEAAPGLGVSQETATPAAPGITVTSPSTRSITFQTRPGPVPLTATRPRGVTEPILPSSITRPSSSESEASTVSTVSESALRTGRMIREADLAAKQREEFLNKARFGIRDPMAGFGRPDPSLRKYMWIHTPFTNPIWVRDIFDKLSETQNLNVSKIFNYDNWESKHIRGTHSQTQPSYVKPACSWVTADSPMSPWSQPSFGGQPTPGISPNFLYLYFPYLNFDTYRGIVRRRNLIKRRLRHGRAAPVPHEIAELESLEMRVVWEYFGYDPPLNSRRTLDQFGYPSLQDTNARDDDQMLYKLTKHKSAKQDPLFSRSRAFRPASIAPKSINTSMRSINSRELSDDEDSYDDETSYEEEADLRDGNVLMVDSLWLWAIDTNILTTFFPKRESDPREGTLFQQADLRNSIYNELNGDLTGRTENALDLAAFVVFHAVTVLLDKSSHPDLEIFRIFEEAIGLLAERLTQNMKHFRLQTFKGDNSGDESESDDELDQNNPASIKKRHKRELERAERENRENTSALLELRDMEDEMNTLLKLFDAQEAMIKTMKTIYSGNGLREITSHGQFYLDEALEWLDEYKQSAKEMVKRVDTVRKDYEKMLEMAQRQAQVDEVRWSRLQTELASNQNLSVMIFTTFTVIFLPLSFFTGLFGINVKEWDEELPTLGFVGAISLPVSGLLIVLAFIGAYSWRAQSLVKSTYKRSKRVLHGTLEILGKLEPKATRARKQRRKAEERRRRKAEQAKKEKDRAYDFWATVKRGRTTQYQIPHLNRHSE